MNKFTHLSQFVQKLFDDADTANKANKIVEGILKAQSPRMSAIARKMSGSEEANYKCIQRFLAKNSPQQALLRLFQEEASFVIGDPTEMPRPQANESEYVGTLSDGKTSGYWLLILATPFHGRAIPCLATVLPKGSAMGLPCSACLPEWVRCQLYADGTTSTIGEA